MQTPNWTEFTRLIYIKASIPDLYHKWASQSGLESWFLRSAVFNDANGEKRSADEQCAVGDSYIWKWHNWEGEHRGKVLEANGKDRIVMEFDPAIIEIDIQEGRGMTMVRLRQYNMPTDEETKYKVYHGSACGWTFWLANLKAVMEHGITLNDDQPGIIGVHSEFDVVNM